MYETIFTNNKNFGGNFLKEFELKLKTADDLIIASGYFGASIVEKLRKRIVSLSKRGNCKILIGMIFYSGVTAKQKELLVSLDDELRAISPMNGIYISMRPYHGKIYKFKKQEESDIYLGSSNFSQEGFYSRYECTTLIVDSQTKSDIHDYLDDLFNLDTTINLAQTDLRVKGKSTSMPIPSSELSDYEIPASDFPDVSMAIGEFKIKLRVDEQPRSSFNLYFEKGRLNNSTGKYSPRPWYEVEITTTSTEQENPFYPKSERIDPTKKAKKGHFYAYIKQNDKYYKIKMAVHADSGKNISSAKKSGGRTTLGKLIKGQLETAGLLKEGDLLTSDILDAYGNDSINFIKISDEDYVLEF